MSTSVLQFFRPVTLVGGGDLDRVMLQEAMALAPDVVAADGAADRLPELGVRPDAVIGDMDSISDADVWSVAGVEVVALAEQDTTDFEKCLYATDAPFYVAAGFTGRRVDHMLAVLHGLLAHPDKRVVLLGTHEVMAILPAGRRITWRTEPGAVVSIFPLRPIRGVASAGLEWPIEGLAMSPGRQIGTSNRTTASEASVQIDGEGALLILERAALAALVEALFG